MSLLQHQPWKRYRVLCLHGMGTNSDIFEVQTAGLRYRLGCDYDFDFIDGSHPCPPAAGIEEVFGLQDYYSYHDGSPGSILEAVNDLADYIEDNGPFDMVLGFSLGAGMAATMLLRDAKNTIRSDPCHSGSRRALENIKCAVFVCAAAPVDWQTLENGIIKQPSILDVAEQIKISTVHAWSPQDLEYRHQSAQLVQMCNSARRAQILHGVNHGVPSSGRELDDLANAIQKVMSRFES